MKILASTLIAISIVSAYKGCSPADPQNSNTVVEANTPQTYKPNAQQSPEKVEFKGERVDFNGVSFKYNPKVLGKVTAEEIPDYPLEQPDYKPDGVAPQHEKNLLLMTVKRTIAGKDLLRSIRSMNFRECMPLTKDWLVPPKRKFRL